MKYGVKLVTYGGQEFNMWVGGSGEDRFSTEDVEAAYNEKIVWETKNPKGYYVVAEIKEETNV